jgi:hypothetical protein
VQETRCSQPSRQQVDLRTATMQWGTIMWTWPLPQSTEFLLGTPLVCTLLQFCSCMTRRLHWMPDPHHFVNTHPGVLTETTAELAAALTLSAARRVVEADVFMRGGKYKGWLPDLFVGLLLQDKTVGIIGAGRIGSAYARMMVEGHKMDLVRTTVHVGMPCWCGACPVSPKATRVRACCRCTSIRILTQH